MTHGVSSEALTAEDQFWIAGAEQIVDETRLHNFELASVPNASKARRSSHDSDDNDTQMSIIERDGILYLEDSSQAGFLASKGARRDSGPRIQPGKTLLRKPLKRLPPSKVYEALEKADRKMTPNCSDGDSITGLRSWTPNGFKPENSAIAQGRILLFVHGTFSNNDNIFEKIQSKTGGNKFLTEALKKYDQILAFDHRTLGVSPMLNANELARFLDDSDAEVDVICHSRGGLVTRWWAEVFDKKMTRKVRIVFVASPMAGTSLASPHNIRESMNLLANYSRAVARFGKGASFVAGACPLFTVATVLFESVSSVTRVMAKTPVADAAIALVPGLDAMSRVGNNHELIALQKEVPIRSDHEYFAVKANFETTDVGWKFWRAFRSGKERIKNAAADFVFQDENDLVVDCTSMADITPNALKSKNILDFGETSVVHHTNYFEQDDVNKRLGEWLLKGVPDRA